MVGMIFLSAFATLTVQVTVVGKPDPREITQVTATCRTVETTSQVCLLTDDLGWVVLHCNERECDVVDRGETNLLVL